MCCLLCTAGGWTPGSVERVTVASIVTIMMPHVEIAGSPGVVTVPGKSLMVCLDRCNLFRGQKSR